MGHGVKACSKAEQIGKALYKTLDFQIPGGEVYRVSLSDQIFFHNLPDQDLAQICKNSAKQGFYFSPEILQKLKDKLDPNHQGISLPAQTERSLASQIQWLIDHPPPVLESEIPNTNQYVFTSIQLDSAEVAIMRQAIGDSLNEKGSFFRRIPNPFQGPIRDDGPARYALSIHVDATQYDKMFFYLSQLLVGGDASPGTRARVAILLGEIGELKTAHLRKREAEKPLIIPDSYFGNALDVVSGRKEIARFLKDTLPVLNPSIDLADYTLFREPLFPSDIAFLRWKMGDTNNKLFVNYNGVVAELHKPQAFYIRKDVDFDKLIAVLAVLEKTCRVERTDDTVGNRVSSLIRETERIDRKVKDESFWHKIREGLPVAIDFVGLGGGLGAVAKGPDLVKWIIQKLRGPKDPPSSTPGGGKIGEFTSSVEREASPIDVDKSSSRYFIDTANILKIGEASAEASLIASIGYALLRVAPFASNASLPGKFAAAGLVVGGIFLLSSETKASMKKNPKAPSFLQRLGDGIASLIVSGDAH